MRSSLYATVLLCSGIIHGAEDTKLSFVAGVGFGVTELSFPSKLDADTSFHTYQVFGSVSYDNAYASLTYADSLDDADVSEEDELGTASRVDIDLTLGYRLSDRWTLFLGYKDGETALDLQVRDTEIVQEEYYREDGFYGGVTFSHNMQRAGTLNFSLAYIRFNTDLAFTQGFDEEEDEEDEEEDEPVEFDDLEGRFSGDSDGVSAGISWVIPVSPQVAFRAQYKINQYNLEVWSDGVKFEPRQRLSYFDVGLLYAF